MSINVEANLTNALPDDWQRDMADAISKLEAATDAHEQAGKVYVKAVHDHSDAKRVLDDTSARAHLEARTNLPGKPTADDLKYTVLMATMKEREAVAIAYVLKEAADVARDSAKMKASAAEKGLEAVRQTGFMIMAEMKLNR